MPDQRLPAVRLPPREKSEPETPRDDRRATRENAGKPGKGQRKAVSGIRIGKRKGPMREHRAKHKTNSMGEL